MIYIYTLTDPITNQVRYVGKTDNPHRRLRSHLNEARSNRYNNHRINWLKGLIRANLKPIMDIIDEVEGDWDKLEIYWISQFKSWGFDLVNSTDGGENPPSFLGKKHTPEHIKKWVSGGIKFFASLENGLPQEWKENISKAHKNNGFLPTQASEANMKQVDQYDLQWNYIKTWSSLTDAARGVGLKRSYAIGAVCRGERNKAGGYRWKLKSL